MPSNESTPSTPGTGPPNNQPINPNASKYLIWHWHDSH